MSLCYSYTPDYFSLSDILATQERVSCKVEVVLPGLGFIDAASESKDLKPGTKLELPFWLAYPLNARRQPIVSIDVPKVYKESYSFLFKLEERFREILQADACAVDLSKWNLYYYELGMYLTRFNHRECEKITDLLLQTFRSRFRLIMDWAQNPGTDATVGSQLPFLERGLFLAGTKAKVQLVDWLKKGGGSIETSEMVANHKKRKRTEFENDD